MRLKAAIAEAEWWSFVGFVGSAVANMIGMLVTEVFAEVSTVRRFTVAGVERFPL